MEIKRWTKRQFDKAASQAVSAQLGIPLFVSDILAARGYDTPEKVKAFTGDGAAFFDPFLLRDMDKAVARIHTAVEEGQRIAVYGDYDCDGITATVLLYHYLEAVGGDVIYYIPQRETEGYGLNNAAIDLMHQHGVALVITVDNGVTAIDEIAYAATLGLDVVVTDHHQPRDILPGACAVIDPHRQDCPSPFKLLAGVGVAFKLICALEEDEGQHLIEEYGDLVALGTLADVVHISGENRTLARKGVALMSQTQRPGLLALLEVAGLGDKTLTSESVVYGLVPRINATGRLGSVDDAVELLLCEDPERSMELARGIDALNAKRKAIEAGIYQELVARIEADELLKHQRLLVLAGEGWHPGVVGIAAARLTERYGRPCLLLAIEGEEARGSARSIEGFSMVEAISACAPLLTRYGGHNRAAGLTLPAANIPAFTEAILAYAARRHDIMPTSLLLLDRLIQPQEMTLSNIAALQLLEPFGEGNEQPVFLIENLLLEGIYPVGEGKHLRLKLSKNGQSFYAIYFGVTPQDFPLGQGEQIDIAACLSVNQYNGEQRVNIRIRDLRPAGLEQERLHNERQAYDKYRRGESFAAVEQLAPTRDEVAVVYRYLKEQGGLRYGCDAASLRLISKGISYIKFRLILDILLDLNLATLTGEEGQRTVVLMPRADKVDIASSGVYDKIRSMKLVIK